MRLTVEERMLLHRPKADVKLDGLYVEGCVEADEEAGFVIVQDGINHAAETMNFKRLDGDVQLIMGDDCRP